MYFIDPFSHTFFPFFLQFDTGSKSFAALAAQALAAKRSGQIEEKSQYVNVFCKIRTELG
jgi:hypothetical protein